jgi:AraC-like DNA-binding protein/ligand-binding sensor protein
MGCQVKPSVDNEAGQRARQFLLPSQWVSSGDDVSHSERHAEVRLQDLREVFDYVAREYHRRWGMPCVLTDIGGHVVNGAARCRDSCLGGSECAQLRQQAIEEAARWGEAFIHLCPDGGMIWAVPIMHNQRLLGGIVAGCKVQEMGEEHASVGASTVTEAADDLLQRASKANLTNAALLELRRLEAHRESQRAEAIHDLKSQSYQSIRDIYLVEEPALISAIKRGDPSSAREIINRVLVGIYFTGRDRPMLLKSFLLELVVTMSRTAVEAGADPSELLGANFSSFTQLAAIEGEEELCAWLVDLLERIMDAIHTHQHYPVGVLLSEAIRYMRENLHAGISRDDVARVACLSPTHFSRVVKQTFGQSFTELLQQMRVERARELLAVSEKSLVEVSVECGFSDQSYFTKVFQKVTGHTPGEYRRAVRQKVS